MKNVKVLFINSGPVSPKSGDSFAEKYKFLSQYISGYIITPVSGKKHLTVKKIRCFRAALVFIFLWEQSHQKYKTVIQHTQKSISNL